MKCNRLGFFIAALLSMANGLNANQPLKELTNNHNVSAYLIEAKLTITQKNSDVTQEIVFTPTISINQETEGAIKIVKEMPITDLPEKPNIGVRLHALVKKHDGVPYLSVKITNISFLSKATPNPEETAWLHTQSTESWVCAKLDHLPKVIKLPPFENSSGESVIEIKVTPVDGNDKPLPIK